MRPRYLFLITGIGVLAVVCAPAFTPAASHQAPMAPTEKVIYSFQGGTDGWWPASDLTLDPEGNLYGTTSQGGPHGAGTVFRLKRANGWNKEILYSFSGSNDGTSPIAGVVFDNAGNLYGTASGYIGGPATVFKLSPNSHGQWTETVLYTSDAPTYFLPNSDLVFDVHGNLFGAMAAGGDFNGGFVFELIPQPKGLWKEVTLHAFKGADGAIPSSAVALDSSGNVWGATEIGGTGICTYFKDARGCGVVYKLTGSGGKWTEGAVHNFVRGGGNAVTPLGGFLLRNGHIFGTSVAGGDGIGTFFELKRSPRGWTQQILYRFYGDPDGDGPVGRLEVGPRGELFGVTEGGGERRGGTVFALRDSTQGWRESVLHAFGGSNDGYLPMAGVVSDSQGHLYGTTLYGGGTICEGAGCGTVYEVTLSGQDH